MRAYIGITDKNWYEILASTPKLEEVNFWQPGGNRLFQAIQEGELFLFKLHSPEDFIVGGGVFAYSSLLPVSLAWESFGVGNGALSQAEMRRRIEKYRRSKNDPYQEYTIGCILLTQPFFLPKEQWIPVPQDWKSNIVQGKRYDLDTEPGLTLYKELQLANLQSRTAQFRLGQSPFIPSDRFGSPSLVLPRLGQGAFRIMVTDAYERKCAVTGEKVLPVLEAAHIRPYGSGGEHCLSNGLLLRSDLHALFDKGYLTVTTSYCLEVSRRIRDEFENGKEYYSFHGKKIWTPHAPEKRPDLSNLVWHNENVYRG